MTLNELSAMRRHHVDHHTLMPIDDPNGTPRVLRLPYNFAHSGTGNAVVGSTSDSPSADQGQPSGSGELCRSAYAQAARAMEVVAAAQDLRAAGFALARVEPDKKKPVDAGWQTGESAAPASFVTGSTIFNIAIVCGPASGSAVCIDLDGIDLDQGKRVLPPTAMVDHRLDRVGSHWWYRLLPGGVPDEALPGPQTKTGELMADGRLPRFPGIRNLRCASNNAIGVEFRGAGANTVVPPSMTTSGPRQWLGGVRGEPAVVEYPALIAAVETLARQVGWAGRSRTEGVGDESAARTLRQPMMPMPDWLVLSRAWGAKNGERFRQAWNTANANSEDDAALVAMLAFWTDDPRQIERLWLSSPCGQREKTQNRADYRATTIEFVQEARHAV
jgi:hypothetical protein